MATDIREVGLLREPTDEERDAVRRLIPKHVPAAQVDEITSMLLGPR